jgi:uncharacterized protein YndB with AHSA1/START domain
VDTIHHEVWVKADRARVFDAFTTADGLDAWWGKVVHAEPRAGSVIEFDNGLGDPFNMRIDELVPGERAVWECISDYSDPGNPASEWLGHRLTFSLSAAVDRPQSEWMAQRAFSTDSAAGITILDFRHAGWKTDSTWYPFCNAAWGATLAALKQSCEARG